MQIPTDKLEQFLDSLHQGILVLDEHGVVVATNSTLKRLMPGLLTGSSFAECYPELAADFAEYLAGAFAGTATKIERFTWQVGETNYQLMLRFNQVDPGLADRPLAVVSVDDITKTLSLISQFEYNYQELERQLHAARRYQNALLTESFESAAVSVRAYAKPCFELSGDFFHASHYDDKPLFILGDVQSHGIDVALRSITLQHLAKIWLHDRHSPAKVMYDLNNFAISDQEEGLWLCCLLIAVYSPATGSLTYCRAGIPEPVLLHADGRETILTGGGTPLGAFDNEVYEEHTCLVQPTDRLLLFSDGVIETRSATDREDLYGRNGLIADYRRLAMSMDEHYLLPLIERLVEFSASREFKDDLTLAEVIFR